MGTGWSGGSGTESDPYRFSSRGIYSTTLTAMVGDHVVFEYGVDDQSKEVGYTGSDSGNPVTSPNFPIYWYKIYRGGEYIGFLGGGVLCQTGTYTIYGYKQFPQKSVFSITITIEDNPDVAYVGNGGSGWDRGYGSYVMPYYLDCTDYKRDYNKTIDARVGDYVMFSTSPSTYNSGVGVAINGASGSTPVKPNIPFLTWYNKNSANSTTDYFEGGGLLTTPGTYYLYVVGVGSTNNQYIQNLGTITLKVRTNMVDLAYVAPGWAFEEGGSDRLVKTVMIGVPTTPPKLVLRTTETGELYSDPYVKTTSTYDPKSVEWYVEWMDDELVYGWNEQFIPAYSEEYTVRAGEPTKEYQYGYVVEFDSAGGEWEKGNEPTSMWYFGSDSVSYTPNPTESLARAGYTLAGWGMDPAGPAVGDDGCTLPSGHTTLYAIWVRQGITSVRIQKIEPGGVCTITATAEPETALNRYVRFSIKKGNGTISSWGYTADGGWAEIAPVPGSTYVEVKATSVDSNEISASIVLMVFTFNPNVDLKDNTYRIGPAGGTCVLPTPDEYTEWGGSLTSEPYCRYTSTYELDKWVTDRGIESGSGGESRYFKHIGVKDGDERSDGCTLYARYREKEDTKKIHTYAAVFDLDIGEGLPGDENRPGLPKGASLDATGTSETVTVEVDPSSNPSYRNKLFLGWHRVLPDEGELANKDMSVDYLSGKTFEIGYGRYTLRPVWGYRVSYHANNHLIDSTEEDLKIIKIRCGESTVLPDISREPIGRTDKLPYRRVSFSEFRWMRDRRSDKIGEPGESITPDGNLALYAGSTSATLYGYRLIYMSEGKNVPTGGELMAEVNPIKTQYQVSSQTPELSGAKFMGWATYPNAVTTHAKAGELIDLRYGVTILHAVWVKYSPYYYKSGDEYLKGYKVYVRADGLEEYGGQDGWILADIYVKTDDGWRVK